MRLAQNFWFIGLNLAIVLGLAVGPSAAQDPHANPPQDWPVVSWTQFARPNDRVAWKPVDDGWSFVDDGPRGFFRQGKKDSNFKPKFRSPTHLALLEGVEVESFELSVRLRSTEPDYGHRDACLFFGWQSHERYYYAHLAKAMDERANQIFIVNEADRTKISTSTTSGTPWDDGWHWVRVRREAGTGAIEVFFDDMIRPVMTAKDATFGKGKVGMGSFDDRIDVAEVIVKSGDVSQRK
jgi:hypothetical protein